MDQHIMLDQPEQIAFYHMNAQRHALVLEIAGMRHSSGRSINAHIKRTYDIKSKNKMETLLLFTDLINKRFNVQLPFPLALRKENKFPFDPEVGR